MEQILKGQEFYFTDVTSSKPRMSFENSMFIISNLKLDDKEVIEESKRILRTTTIKSNSKKHLLHACRIVFQASYNINRPYDIVKLAEIFNIKEKIVHKSMKAEFHNFINISDLIIEDFISTYLYNVNSLTAENKQIVSKLTEKFNNYENGKSIYIIAKTFVYLFAIDYLKLDLTIDRKMSVLLIKLRQHIFNESGHDICSYIKLIEKNKIK